MSYLRSSAFICSLEGVFRRPINERLTRVAAAALFEHLDQASTKLR
jgi:hypothetical protein